MTIPQDEEQFDYCAVSPDKKHSDEWYCNRDCTHCKAGAQVGPLLWVGSEAPAQEHESLSHFIEKVEASGEDKKHEPTAADIDAQDWKGMDGAIAFHLITRHADNWDHSARLMHAWRDAYAAEAVRQERERCEAIMQVPIQECSVLMQAAEAYGHKPMEKIMMGTIAILQTCFDEIQGGFVPPKG